MKKLFLLAAVAASLVWTACSRTGRSYVDLRSGERIEIEKDPVTGEWLNAETHEPVYIYIDSKSKDTIYGRTGAVINGHVVREDDVYWFDEDLDDEYKVKVHKEYSRDRDYKMEVEKDGDIKIKDGNKKIKIDGETGERKVKIDD